MKRYVRTSDESRLAIEGKHDHIFITVDIRFPAVTGDKWNTTSRGITIPVECADKLVQILTELVQQ